MTKYILKSANNKYNIFLNTILQHAEEECVTFCLLHECEIEVSIFP